MKTKALIILILCFAGLLMLRDGGVAQAQGSNLTNIGPYGGNVSCVTIDPKTPATLYAASGNQVFKSLDAGTTWTLSSTILSTQIATIIVDPSNSDNVLAFVRDNFGLKLYKSTDASKTWNQINTTSLNGVSFTALVTDPVNFNNMFLGTSGGLFKSTNGGITWSFYNSIPLSFSRIGGFAFKPGDSSWMVLSSSSGVFSTTNSGGTWTKTSVGLPSLGSEGSIAYDIVDPNILYVATDTGVFKSQNGAATWTRTNTGIPASESVYTFAVDPSNASTLYAGTTSNIYKTTNKGISWQLIVTGLLNTTNQNFLAVDATNTATVYVAGSAGVFKTVNAGANWSAVNNGINANYVTAFISDPSNPSTMYVGTQTAGAFKTTDSGANWAAINNGLGYASIPSIVIDPFNSATVYAVSGGGVYKSINGGLNWSEITNEATNASPVVLAMNPNNSSNLILGTANGVYRSTNGGANWVPTTGLLGKFIYSVAIDPFSSSTAYAITSFDGLFKSTDGGLTWHQTALNFASGGSIFVSPFTPGKVVILTPDLYTSLDSGGTFTKGGAGFSSTQLFGPFASGIAFDPVRQNVIYAAGPDGLYKSYNNGLTFARITFVPDELTRLLINPAIPNTFFAGSFMHSVYSLTTGSDVTPPTVTITKPIDGQILDNRNVLINGTVTDDAASNGIASLTLNGNPVAFDQLGAFSKTVTAPADGQFPITITATDASGNTSAPVTVSVLIDTVVPTITIDSPTTGQTINGQITVTGTVNDSGSGLAVVTVNHVKATIAGNTYTAVINNACNAGAVTLTAVATDLAGNSASTNRSIKVTGATATSPCVSPIGPYRADIKNMAIAPSNSNILYAVDDNGRAFKSTDAGSNWAELPHGLQFTATYTGGPHSVAIDPIDPQIVYVTDVIFGVNKTTDGGLSWSLVSTGLPSGPDQINCIVIGKSTGTVYVGTRGGIYKSIDAGAHWQLLTNGISDSQIIRAIAIDPNNSANIYAVGYFNFAKSTDDGQSWTVVTGLFPNQEASVISVNPTASNVLFVIDGNQLEASFDSGATFAPLQNAKVDTGFSAVFADPTRNNTVFAGSFQGMYKSTTGGANIFPINNGLVSSSIRTAVIDQNNPANVYAATAAGIFKSSDGGSTWVDSSIGITSLGVTGLSKSSALSNTIFAATTQGVARSTNGGTTWSFVNTGLPTGVVNAVAVSATDPQTVYTSTTSGMFKSTNGGLLWTATTNPGGPGQQVGFGALAIDPTNAAVVYASSSMGALKTTDGGTTWTSISNGLPGVNVLMFSPSDSNVLYAGTTSGLYKTTSGGATWTRLSPQNNFLGVNSIALSALQPGTIYYTSISPQISKSVDGGLTWKSLSNGLGSFDIRSVIVDPKNPNLVYSASSTVGSIFVSNNGGTDWAQFTYPGSNAFGIGPLMMDAAYPGTIYAGTSSRGVLLIQLQPDTTAPVVTITTPAANSSTSAATITVTGTVTDVGSGIASVTVNGGAATYDPSTNKYTGLVTAANEGPFQITVTATDNAGNTSQTVTSQIIVDRTPPSLTIDSPAEGSSITRHVVVTGTVTDSGGGIASVFVNQFRATITGNTYSVTLPDECNHSITITAVAFDKALNNTIVSRNVTVADPNPLPCWDNTGPEGGVIFDVATNPANSGLVFAAGAGQVFRSVDAAATWTTPTANATLGGTISSLLVIKNAPNIMYFSGTGGVYKSTDSGLSWHPSLAGLPSSTGVLTGDPANASILYVSTSTGIFKSTDGGVSWVPANSGITGTPRIVAVDPNNSGILYAGTSTTIFKSTNSGATWIPINIGLPATVTVSSIIVDPGNSNTVYAGTFSGIYKSVNAGVSWVNTSSGLTDTLVNVLRFDPISQTTIYAGTQTNLFKSIDAGGSWSPSGTGLPARSPVNGIAFDNSVNLTIYLATRDGVYKSVDNGSTWLSSNRGLIGNRSLITAVDPNSPNVLYTTTLGSLYKSVDGGVTWNFLSGDLAPASVTQLIFDPFNPNAFFAASQAGVYKSVDGGATWTSLSVAGTVIAFDPYHSGTIYSGDFNSLYKSTNGGLTWTEVPKQGFIFNITRFRSVTGIVFDPTIPNTIYVANQLSLTKTTDGGQTWTDIFSGFGTFQCLAMDIVDPKTFYGCANGMIKSTDGGVHWSPSGTGLPGGQTPLSLVQSPDNPTVLYAGELGSRIYKTVDSGANWSAIDPLFIGFGGTGFSLNRDDLSILYAGGVNGLFTLRQATDPNELVPAISGLSQSIVPLAGPAFNLTITGSNFVTGSKVLWNGSPRLTAFNSGSQLTASITAADTVIPGLATVTVMNPGNHTSNSQTVKVGKTDQTIAFGPLPNKTFNGTSFTIDATASSGLPVSFSVVSGPASVSGNTVTMLGAGTVVLEAHQDGNAAFNAATPVDQSFVINNPLAQILKLSPGAIIAGSGQTTVKILGGFYVADTLVKVDGTDHTATYINPIEMDMVLSPAEIATPGTKTIRVFNSAPGGGTSIAVTLKIISITSSDSKNIQPGTTDTVSNAPTQSGDAGITAQLNHSQSAGGQATVTVQQYSADPLGGSGLIDVGGGYVDLKVTGSAPDDTLNAIFYYGSNVTGTNEDKLQLLYFTGSKWAKVRSSGNTDPIKNTSDNQDGTVSGGTFTVVFDETSSPKLSQLTGTIFTSTPGLYGDLNNDQVINVVDLILMANFLAGNTTVDKTAGDLTLDGKLNVSDLITLANFLAGNVAHLPASTSP